MSDRSDSIRPIVVGVDGSVPARRALDWAMAYAELKGAPVLAVRAWQVPFSSGVDSTVMTTTEYVAAMRRDLENAVDEAALEHPGVHVSAHLVEGRPGRVLVEQSEHADLLVVGSRGHGRLVDAAIGSVSRYCIAHGHAPVLVTPGNP